ncbi:MAG TPA: VOC family protein [Bacteroidales bacterium]|nr:VOC family protein [Bacteroidales bacterium]HRZ76993.1 VOC family protein [Bacteroidales bacterium]
MTTANIYLNFNGTCEEAFNFYRSVFGGDFSYLGRFGDMPPMEGVSMDETMARRIMHVALPMGGDTLLMGSDLGNPEQEACFVQGTNFSVMLSPGSREEADRLHHALSLGGLVTMPMAMMFWGDYFGTLTDRFGIQWMISFAAGLPDHS